jgi:hypothetical protein
MSIPCQALFSIITERVTACGNLIEDKEAVA